MSSGVGGNARAPADSRIVTVVVLTGVVLYGCALYFVTVGGRAGFGASLLAVGLFVGSHGVVRRAIRRRTRRFVGRPPTAWESVDRLSVAMQQAGHPEQILHELAVVVLDGTGATSVVIRVVVGDEMVDVATGHRPHHSGHDGAIAHRLSAPIADRDGTVGSIDIELPAEPAAAAERLVTDLARAAAGVGRGIQLRHVLERQLERARAAGEEVNRARARTVIAQLDERRRLERDLHDTCQQRAVVLASCVRRRSDRDGNDLEHRHAIDDALDRLNASLDAVTSTAGIRALLDRGLGFAVREQFPDLPVCVRDETRRRHGTRVESVAFACCSEAVHNALRHGRPSSVVVRLNEDCGSLRIEVTDDGSGIADADEADGRVLLRSLRERVADVGGSLDVRSSSAGVSVVAVMPSGEAGT